MTVLLENRPMRSERIMIRYTLEFHADTVIPHPVVFRSAQLQAARTPDDEKRAFLSMLPMLMERHPGQHVIIESGLVADSDDSRRALVRRFFSQPRHLPVYIGFVGPHRSIRVPTPRIHRQR